ncbi:MAG: protein kinase [Solirubrobacterales bacterium]|nr:protein kinase [Solirubrobacterales bacterium]MBV9714427.1 protein kinase [Solirubrobacterales bacterium]
MNGPRTASQVLGLTLGGRYRVLEPISSGAMGAVYRAVDLETDTEVALKQSTSPQHDQRFEAEARLLTSLEHPRVVRIRDHFAASSGQYLVMDLVRGIDLDAVLKQQGQPGLSVEQAIEIVREACEALQYVHDQQIVHRDVKPQNLILSQTGVVLVDFGIARLLDESEPQGTVGIGTPRFMAPEVFAGGHVSPRTDVFSVAATLWTLLAGRPPVYADSTRLSAVVPGVTAELERTIVAGLEMIPERRVASVAAFAKALGAPLRTEAGVSLAVSIEDPDASRDLMEAVVHTAAGVFGAAAASICLLDETTGELVYQSAWGAGAREIVGVRLPSGAGIAGIVVQSGAAEAVPDCRSDPRFAARIAEGTGYVPYTMLVVPLQRAGRAIGALSILDRRDGRGYRNDDLEPAALFADLAVKALDVSPGSFTSLGMTALR